MSTHIYRITQLENNSIKLLQIGGKVLGQMNIKTIPDLRNYHYNDLTEEELLRNLQ